MIFIKLHFCEFSASLTLQYTKSISVEVATVTICSTWKRFYHENMMSAENFYHGSCYDHKRFYDEWFCESIYGLQMELSSPENTKGCSKIFIFTFKFKKKTKNRRQTNNYSIWSNYENSWLKRPHKSRMNSQFVFLTLLPGTTEISRVDISERWECGKKSTISRKVLRLPQIAFWILRLWCCFLIRSKTATIKHQ